jgi:hypothetical protein
LEAFAAERAERLLKLIWRDSDSLPEWQERERSPRHTGLWIFQR